MKTIINKQLKKFDKEFIGKEKCMYMYKSDARLFISTAIKEAYLKGFVEGLTEQDKIKKKGEK